MTRRDTTPDRDELIEELRQDKAYLQDALDRALAQLENERERADVLMREALSRIEALTAGPAGDAGEDAPQSAHAGPGDETAGNVADDAPQSWWRRWWRSLMAGS